MNNRLIAALLLGAATITMGPVACNMSGTDAAVSAPGTAIGIDVKAMDKSQRE
jgi:hypothetical protein